MNAQKRQLRVYLGENEPVQDLRGSTFLPDFKSGTMVESFHRSGIAFNLMDWLKGPHKALMPSGPKCRRWSYARPSGPLALELPARLMASVTCAWLNWSGRPGSNSVLWSRRCTRRFEGTWGRRLNSVNRFACSRSERIEVEFGGRMVL